MWESIIEFFYAVASYWWAIIPGLALEGGRVLGLVWGGYDEWAGRVFPRDRQRRWGRILVVLGLVLATFLAFHDERTRHQETKEKLSAVRSVEESRLEIRTIDTTTKTNPDGTYTIVRLIEVVSLPRQGILKFIVYGKGIINLKVKTQGQLMTLYGAGGGTADSAFLEIQNPWGKYLVVVQTRNADDVIFDYSFE